MPGIYHLKGSVKHYDWGGIFFIPSLLNMENKTNHPFAELWLGTHRLGDCQIEFPDQSNILLREFIDEHPEALGKRVEKKFGQLPYLLKAMDVKNMLSIQVHPSKRTAEKEFARENKEGIPLDSPKRNYKDDNHKPEMIVAMSDFWLIHGFKPKEKLTRVLKTIPEFNLLLILFEKFGYEGLYKSVMEMPQHEVNDILKPLLDRVIPLYKKGELDRSHEDFWAARAALTFLHHEKIDRGIFSIYFFNLVHLKKGEGIFQDAGVPHAYLEGQNIEIMANSDNVLRGGLTNKHIDVKELLKNVKCKEAEVEILRGEKLTDNEIVYKTSAPDFQLSVFHLQKGKNISFSTTCAEIFLLTSGHVIVKNKIDSMELKPGKPSAIVLTGEKAELSAVKDSMVFRATVPV